MALKKKPTTGMKDILPREMEIRDYVIGQIKETYRTFGFQSIETPCVEHIENLNLSYKFVGNMFTKKNERLKQLCFESLFFF